jgi:putative two-component system response regulator
MRKHCEYGKAIIDPTTDGEAELARKYSDLGLMPRQSVESPLLTMAASIATTHHERFNGSGYPAGIVGEAIPLEGRITAIVDVFDALHSPRPYKAAFPTEKCLEILQSGRGTEFDPAILDAFLSRIAEIIAVYRDYAD